MTDTESGFIHPTGVARPPVVKRHGSGLTVEAESVEAACAALAREPLVTGDTGPIRFSGHRWPGGRCTITVWLAVPALAGEEVPQ